MDNEKDIFYDVRKAFDRYYGLLYKLQHYNVAGSMLTWIEK